MLARTLVLLSLVGSLAHPASAARGGGRIGGQNENGTTTSGNGQESFYNNGGNSTPDKGSFTYNDGRSIKYSADIDCVRVDGNVTFLSGVIRTATKTARYLFGIVPGCTYLFIRITDNGEPEQDRVGTMLINPYQGQGFGEGQGWESSDYCEQNLETNNDDLANGNVQTFSTGY